MREAAPSADENQDLALNGLILLAHYYGIAVNPQDIRHRFDPDGTGMDATAWLLASKDLGLKSRLLRQKAARLPLMPLPALVWKENGEHFILARVDGGRYLTHDLRTGKPAILSESDFLDRYEGRIVAVASRASILGSLTRFDFTWFIPAVVKYRRIFLEVLAVSVVLQLFTLMTPLFFQVVMDKVLVHRGFAVDRKSVCRERV